tara:strand:+ start:2645 stop:3853 length:1209 start_codon:yes stop_codon:yes gene_type:complete
MATRTRVISQSKAVFVGPTDISHNTDSGYIPDQLHRIDNFSFDIDIAGARQDIREFGQLARIDSLTMSDITPSISFGYYLTDGENEARLGFNDDGITGAAALVDSQFISGIITEDANKKEKNIYVLTAKEGLDAFNSGEMIKPASRSASDAVSFGNVVINNYSASFAVGDIPRVDIEAEASNIIFTAETYSGFNNPAITDEGVSKAGTVALIAVPAAGTTPKAPSTGDSAISVLRPEDISITFSSPSFDMGGTNFSDMHVQSASIDVPLARGNIEALGKARAVAKPLEFPIDVTMSFSSLLKNFDAGTLDLVLTGTAGNQKTDITLSIGNDDSLVQSKFVLKNAQLDSQAFSQGLDDNETVDLTFSAQIGGPNTTNQGLFYSGSANPTVDATGATNSYDIVA